MSSTYYFEFLGSVWDNLSEGDRERFGELWHGYEQVFASVYQKFLEGNLNIAHQDLQPFATERWLPFSFNDSNFVPQPAILTSSQDLSRGINLLTKNLLKLELDETTVFEVRVSGTNPGRTTIDEIIQKINEAAGFTFAKGIFENTIIQLTSKTIGVNSRIRVLPTSDPLANACEFVLGIMPSELPKLFPEYPYIYEVPYSNIASIPEFTDKVRDESVSETLIENVNFKVGVSYEVSTSEGVVLKRNSIAFKENPTENLWARRVLFDEEDPWNNFGFLMDIYQPNSARYTNVLQGLWFAFWTGPKPSNVKKALYLLFGLPTAKENGVITSVTTTAITLQGDSGESYTYELPTDINPVVVAGQRVERFEPLTDGINVFDKINYPGFVEEEAGRAGIQRFLLDGASRGPGDTDETKALTILEEYTFLPQISVNAFIDPQINLSNVKTFLDAIKPLNKAYLFQVIVGDFRDKLDLQERVAWDEVIDVTPVLDSNETTFIEEADLLDYETNDNAGLNTDSNGIVFRDKLEIEVRSFGSLIDTFEA